MPKVGRPRSGTSTHLKYWGEQVSTFVKLTGRYPPKLAAELRELASVTHEPLWGILVAAAEAYVAKLDPKLKGRVERQGRAVRADLERQAREQYDANRRSKARPRQTRLGRPQS